MDRFLIAPFYSGLRTDLKPWLIPDEAFETLRNAYVFRGRIRKRFGGVLMGEGATSSLTAPLLSRLRIPLVLTDGSGNASGTVPGTIFAIGQAFSIGDEIFTVYQTGTPAAMLDTGAATTATFNTTTGAYNFVGATPATQVYFYTALPVMGITNYEVGPINDQPSFAFDTQFAYTYVGGSWIRSGTFIWHGPNTHFFWAYNWRGATAATTILFVSNYNSTIPTPAATDDPIAYYDGTTWTAFTPYFLTTGAPGTGPFVQTAKIIIAFKNRLLLLNTIEQTAGVNTAYTNRCRYSFVGSPFATNAWYEEGITDTSGNTWQGGGFVDATTEEQIIGAEFIKDRLIVYFERSTWELAYTGNQVEPFLFQKINTELGSEATFSSVPFDKVILTIGNTGVHACNGANVERIDKNIPQEVFKIENKNEGVTRVAGIRDYFTEMVYWTFPSDDENPSETYPNRVLIYNYQNGAWAFNDDCITTWGYFEQQTDQTWVTSQGTWENANYSWTSGILEAQFRQVTAGNQQGYIFIVNADQNRNAPVMQITNIIINNLGFPELTIIDHTLNTNDFILIENAQGVFGLNDEIFEVVFVDSDTIYIYAMMAGIYTGGGSATRVSQIDILTKQFNPYINQGKNVFIQKIDFGIEKTASGQITVDYYPSSTEESMINNGILTDTLMGTGILETSPYDPLYYPLEQVQSRLWHSIYFQTLGECIQLRLFLNASQMKDIGVSLSPFELEGMILYTRPEGRLE